MLSIGVDWVALSFVQRPEDIVEIKRLIMEYNPNNAFPPRVMAKIEKPSVRSLFECICYCFCKQKITYILCCVLIVSALWEILFKRLLNLVMASVSLIV